uniref:Uncharacterized protein n=1 Tax=Moniliophthora roreri TaxID=221103 RepID=A0A0W0GBP9_MONRR
MPVTQPVASLSSSDDDIEVFTDESLSQPAKCLNLSQRSPSKYHETTPMLARPTEYTFSSSCRETFASRAGSHHGERANTLLQPAQLSVE